MYVLNHKSAILVLQIFPSQLHDPVLYRSVELTLNSVKLVTAQFLFTFCSNLLNYLLIACINPSEMILYDTFVYIFIPRVIPSANYVIPRFPITQVDHVINTCYDDEDDDSHESLSLFSGFTILYSIKYSGYA